MITMEILPRPAWCLRKIPYKTAAGAYRAVTRMHDKRRKDRRGLEVYRCRACGHWHVGGQRMEDEGRVLRRERRARLEALREAAAGDE